MLSPILFLSLKFARNIVTDKPKIYISNPLAVRNVNGIAPPPKNKRIDRAALNTIRMTLITK